LLQALILEVMEEMVELSSLMQPEAAAHPAYTAAPARAAVLKDWRVVL
jgi:hypothetical protein